MSSNPYGLTNAEVVYELASTLHSSLLQILGYGMYTTVYFVALYLTLSHGNHPRVGSAVLITIMWILVTIQLSVGWTNLDNIYIQRGATRDEQSKVLLSPGHREFFSLQVANAAVTLSSILLADMTMIWRCWVLYGGQWLVVIIPGSSLAVITVCYIWRTILVFRPILTGVMPNQRANLELSYLSATVLTNLFCTTAIICRITRISGWRKSLETYRGLMEILVESSILYTAIYVIRIGLQIYTQYFTEELDERLLYAHVLALSITGLAPTLIIARVAAGYARPDDSWTRTSLPHMGSTMRSLAESLHFAQPATGTAVDNVDLERSTRSEVSVGVDDSRRETLKGTTQTEPEETSKEV